MGKENLYLLGGHHQSGHSRFLVVHIHIHILVEEIQHTACNKVKKKKKGCDSVGEFGGEMRHLYSRCRYRTPPEAPCPSWRIWRKEEASQRLQKKAVISPRVSSQINGGTLTLDEFLVL